MDIKNIFGASPESNKIVKNNETKKSKSVEETSTEDAKSNPVNGSGDKAEISSFGRELFKLRAEAAEYIEEIKTSRTISEEEIEEIKEKILEGHYFDPEVIDKVIDRLLNLPHFK